MKYIGTVVVQYISNNERTTNVTKRTWCKGQGQECVQYIYLIYDPQIQRETTVQVYTIDLYAKRFEKTRKDEVFFVVEKKRKVYHVREDGIKPRCRLQLPSVPHTGTIPHHAVRSSRQSMRFTPCLLVISASPGVRLHR